MGILQIIRYCFLILFTLFPFSKRSPVLSLSYAHFITHPSLCSTSLHAISFYFSRFAVLHFFRCPLFYYLLESNTNGSRESKKKSNEYTIFGFMLQMYSKQFFSLAASTCVVVRAFFLSSFKHFPLQYIVISCVYVRFFFFLFRRIRIIRGRQYFFLNPVNFLSLLYVRNPFPFFFVWLTIAIILGFSNIFTL